MKLPRAHQAIVAGSKVTGYLLSQTHPHGRHKAAFFSQFGFTSNDWQALAHALLTHAQEPDVYSVEDTIFGTRYTIEGSFPTPSGQTPMLRSVWFIQEGLDDPQFVTA